MKPRDIQTRIKHDILQKYLIKWGSIITRGLARNAQHVQNRGHNFASALLYIDCFAFEGQYLDSETNEVVDGSPIIGIRALDEVRENAKKNLGFLPQVNAILIEQDRSAYKTLIENLQSAGYSGRIRETDRLSQIDAQAIICINGDALDYISSICTLAERPFSWSFGFLDPYGPSGIPLQTVVQPIVCSPRMDAIVYFPYFDLIRKASPASRDIQPEHVALYDQVYGNSSWAPIAERYFSSSRTLADKDALERDLVDLYQSIVTGLDPNLSVKRIAMQFPALRAERTLYYLFLTTHDETGAFEMNEVIDVAEAKQYLLRDARQRRTSSGTQLSLYDVGMEDEKRPLLAEPDIAWLDDLVFDRCEGERLSFRDIMRRMVNENGIYLRHLKSALGRLRRKGRAAYDGKLRNDTLITFTTR